MEEDINFIRKYMQDYYSEDIAIEDDFKFEKAIENLLKRYKELEEENKELKWLLAYKEVDLENSIPISVIQNKLEQNKAKTDCRYCNNACDSYAVCTVLKEILEKGNK